MNNLYDNGHSLLGTKKDIIKHLTDKIESDDMNKIADFLKKCKDNDIVCISYDFGMPMSFEVWKEKDIVEESE